MREDMFKIIVERPRTGRRWAGSSKLRIDKCVDRSRVSGRRLAMESGGVKHLNENLAPLKRYLHKQVGRPWNDVFSEICQHLDTGSTVKMHVREHLDDFVERHVQVDGDGEFWVIGWRPTKLVFSGTELYVDPADGRLKATVELCRTLGFNSVRKCRRQYYDRQRDLKRDSTWDKIKPLGELKWHVQLRGIWYEVTLSCPPTTVYWKSNPSYPMSLYALYNDVRKELWRHHLRFAVTHKKQLSEKALKAHGLRNQPEIGESYYG